jgi:pimeloyl-ACP methyl ester carboxylesterase
VFLPGFKSDMTGAKALETEAFCAAHGYACLRLDYSGHGASGGAFADGTVGRWAEDALFLIDRLTQDELLVVGSSMGGWIALLVALARPERVAGLIGIAAAPDFTEELMWASMTPAEQELLMRDGVLHVPSQYGDAYLVTKALIEDGRSHLLLGAPIPIHCPVRLLQGQRDADVPWRTALRLAEQLEAEDV